MKKLLFSALDLLAAFRLGSPGAALSARADSQQTYLQCLTNFETYAESIWHTASYSGAPADSGYWGDGGNSGNGGIRGNSGVAVAYAVLVLALPSDPRTATRLSRIRQALNYDAATHVTGANNTVNGGKWGCRRPWRKRRAGSGGKAGGETGQNTTQTEGPPVGAGCLSGRTGSELCRAN